MEVTEASEGPLSHVLDAAENASPLQAVEAVTDALAQVLGAEAAFFLITRLRAGSRPPLARAAG